MAARLGKATWKNKDFDEEIEVTGFEDINGKRYAKIKGSKTGIPIDEIDFGPDPGAIRKIEKPLETKASRLNKVASEAMDDVAKMTEKAMKTIPWGTKALGWAAGIIAVAGVADYVVDEIDHNRMLQQRQIQERSRKKQESSMMQNRWVGMSNPRNYDGVVQGLFDQRIGHTNTWGGSKY